MMHRRRVIVDLAATKRQQEQSLLGNGCYRTSSMQVARDRTQYSDEWSAGLRIFWRGGNRDDVSARDDADETLGIAGRNLQICIQYIGASKDQPIKINQFTSGLRHAIEGSDQLRAQYVL